MYSDGIVNSSPELIACANKLKKLSEQLNDNMERLKRNTEVLEQRHKDIIFVELSTIMNSHMKDLKALSNNMEEYSKFVLEAHKVTGRYFQDSNLNSI